MRCKIYNLSAYGLLILQRTRIYLSAHTYILVGLQVYTCLLIHPGMFVKNSRVLQFHLRRGFVKNKYHSIIKGCF